MFTDPLTSNAQLTMRPVDVAPPPAFDDGEAPLVDRRMFVSVTTETPAKASCCCGKPSSPGIKHRMGVPCYVRATNAVVGLQISSIANGKMGGGL